MKALEILIFITLMSFTSCDQQSISGQDLEKQDLVKNGIPCNSNDKILREVSAENGTIGYIQTLDKYVISVVPEGHIDTIIYGVICNTPDELKKTNMKVVFSGQYSELAEKLPTTFPGIEYYNLNLTEYKVLESN